jgi:hypothetical protein
VKGIDPLLSSPGATDSTPIGRLSRNQPVAGTTPAVFLLTP